MLITIKGRAPKTEDYYRYLIKTVIKGPDLDIGELIEIPVIENSTPFPDFTEIPVPPTGKGIVHTEIYGKWKMTTGHLADPRKDIKTQILDDGARRLKRAEAIIEYTANVLREMCSLQHAKGTDDGPIDINFSFLVSDIDKIYQEAEKLGIPVYRKEELVTDKVASAASFNETPPAIAWGDKIIPIEEGSYGYYVCMVAFRNPIGTSISWDEVAEEMEGALKDNTGIKRRAIYDAVRRLNKNVKDRVHKKLFKWKNLSFYRIV